MPNVSSNFEWSANVMPITLNVHYLMLPLLKNKDTLLMMIVTTGFCLKLYQVPILQNRE